jgi:hypothetical protein
MLRGEHTWRIRFGQIDASGDNFIPDEIDIAEREIRKFGIIKSAKLQVSRYVENMYTCGRGETCSDVLVTGGRVKKDEKN